MLPTIFPQKLNHTGTVPLNTEGTESVGTGERQVHSYHMTTFSSAVPSKLLRCNSHSFRRYFLEAINKKY